MRNSRLLCRKRLLQLLTSLWKKSNWSRQTKSMRSFLALLILWLPKIHLSPRLPTRSSVSSRICLKIESLAGRSLWLLRLPALWKSKNFTGRRNKRRLRRWRRSKRLKERIRGSISREIIKIVIILPIIMAEGTVVNREDKEGMKAKDGIDDT